MVLNRTKILTALILVILILTACSARENLIVEIPAERDVPLPTVLPTPVPKNVLSICIGDEPGSLFLYGDQSLSARIIRQAIYDWTADESQSVIYSAVIAEVPTLANGLVTRTEVEVFDGERIVDANGNLTILSRGTEFRPAGCADPGCWETFDQTGSVTMDRVSVEFPLTADLTWSDGTPVTTEDSILSYRAAALIYGARGPGKLQYSASYHSTEEGSVIWVGVPGYQGIMSYTDLFFDPLPAHLLDGFTRDELLISESSSLQPIGWGAYHIVEWVQGDHLTLYPNDYYPQSDRSQDFDALVFRFMNDPEEALAAYFSGECQVVANQSGLSDYQTDLREAEEDLMVQINLGEAKAWEQVSFGIDSLDGSQNILQSPEIRLALAGCVDREKLSSQRLDSGGVVDDFYQNEPSGIDPETQLITYQPVASGLALKELGWIDHDGDPETPRLAQGVQGISPGSSLDLVLLTVDTDRGIASGQLIKKGLETCGVGVEIQSLPASDLLAPGPDGPIFGRHFDLAYFAWAAGNYQPCRLFISDEIPGIYPASPKGWGGVNAPGFSSVEYDSACGTVLTNLPDLEASRSALDEVKTIYRSELPSLPLFFRRDILLSSPEINGLTDSNLPTLWNIESLGGVESGE